MTNTHFLDAEVELSHEILEGLFREGQLVTVAGSCTVGKSPVLQELAACLAGGSNFCGRKVDKRPVIYIDLENSSHSIGRNIRAVCAKNDCDLPQIPAELDIHILQGGAHYGTGSEDLLQLLSENEPLNCLTFLQERLSLRPNAVVIIDPAEMFFKIDTTRKVPILELYGGLRKILARFPHAAIILSFNLRKADRNVPKPHLIRYPRQWMEEVCGSLDIINRSDVRIGIDFLEEDDELERRVINGLRRGEHFDPIIVRSEVEGGILSGWSVCTPAEADLISGLTSKQKEYWDMLPSTPFKNEDIRGDKIPHASLYRLLNRARLLGIVTKSGVHWQKTVEIKRLSLLKLAGLE